jgi:hypothetical protein
VTLGPTGPHLAKNLTFFWQKSGDLLPTNVSTPPHMSVNYVTAWLLDLMSTYAPI